MVDASWTPDTGFRAGLQAGSSGIQGIRPEGQCLLRFARGSAEYGFRVASQNFGPVAGEMPRFARQHTKSPGRTRELVWKRDQGRDARASPEDSQKPNPIRRLCPFENCPADTFLAIAQRCAAPASSITLRFDRVRLSRRPLSRNAITQSA